MNDYSELEAELRKLRPAPASPALQTRVGCELHSDHAQVPAAGVLRLPRRSFRINWLPLGLGVAAAAAFLVLARVDVDHAPAKQSTLAGTTLPPTHFAPVRPTDGLRPAGMSQVVYRTRDEGLLFAEGAKRPVRRMRTEARETLHWRDPGTGASMRVSYPREEVSLIPVSGQ
ncbi:MAG: hypothetical protein ABI871_00095 [Chthoniobacterales bacterium]